MKSQLLAFAAIVFWASLATFVVNLSHVPPFLLTGLGLLVGSLIALPLSGFKLSQWQVPWPTLLLGVYGLFGFHFIFFLALRHAPPMEANLINYLWPLGMVVLAPIMLKNMTLKLGHIVAALMGFAGAALVILGRSGGFSISWHFEWGYVFALLSAFVWASYSLLTRRVRGFPTAAIGTFTAVSGVLSLLCHVWLEPSADLSMSDYVQIVLMGLGPLGGAFFVWDAALKLGDPRRIALLSFLTPLLSTALLSVVQGQPLRWNIMLAALLIVSAAVIGARASQAPLKS